MASFATMFSLKGRTAVVTGGTRGIGAAMAIALAQAGADIILIQRDEKDRRTYAEVENLGRKAIIYKADLSDQSSVERIIPDLVQSGHDMHILLTCAGIQRRHPACQFPIQDWDMVLQVNLTTVFTLCRDFGGYLLSKPVPESGTRGNIINVASVLSYQGGFQVAAYAASKGGVAQLTKALSNEWTSSGIQVNGIAPGYIDTEFNESLFADATRRRQILERIPAGRWGSPDDLRGAVVYLAGNSCQYVSGEMLTADGGWLGR